MGVKDIAAGGAWDMSCRDKLGFMTFIPSRET
jgi:hypothetical protein